MFFFLTHTTQAQRYFSVDQAVRVTVTYLLLIVCWYSVRQAAKERR